MNSRGEYVYENLYTKTKQQTPCAPLSLIGAVLRSSYPREGESDCHGYKNHGNHFQPRLEGAGGKGFEIAEPLPARAGSIYCCTALMVEKENTKENIFLYIWGVFLFEDMILCCLKGKIWQVFGFTRGFRWRFFLFVLFYLEYLSGFVEKRQRNAFRE